MSYEEEDAYQGTIEGTFEKMKKPRWLL